MNKLLKRWTMILLLAVAMMSGGCSTLTGLLAHNDASPSYTNSDYDGAYGAYGGGYASGASYLGGSGSC